MEKLERVGKLGGVWDHIDYIERKLDELVQWINEHEGKGHPGPKGKSKYMRK